MSLTKDPRVHSYQVLPATSEWTWGCAKSSGCQFDLPIDAAWSHILSILQEKTQINAVEFGGEYIGHFFFLERSWLSKALCYLMLFEYPNNSEATVS